MFEVIVKEIMKDSSGNTGEVERYRQTVDALDLRAVMSAVNKRPRRPRTPKERQPA